MLPDYSFQCRQLLDDLRHSGIQDDKVLDIMTQIPREQFVPEESAEHAYDNRALPIGDGQTISQPYIVAAMTSALQLEGDEHLLEIGTGSGYQAAILSQLCKSLVTMERLEELSLTAQAAISRLGITNVEFQFGDGTLGYEPSAPYDGIIVTAAAPAVPNSLWNQLKTGGCIVIPVGDEYTQELITRTKTETGHIDEHICGCRFVKLIGAEGWPE